MAVSLYPEKLIDTMVAMSLDKIAQIIHAQVVLVITVVIVNKCLSLIEIGIQTTTIMHLINVMQLAIQIRIWMMTDVGIIIVVIQVIVTTMIGINSTIVAAIIAGMQANTEKPDITSGIIYLIRRIWRLQILIATTIPNKNQLKLTKKMSSPIQSSESSKKWKHKTTDVDISDIMDQTKQNGLGPLIPLLTDLKKN